MEAIKFYVIGYMNFQAFANDYNKTYDKESLTVETCIPIDSYFTKDTNEKCFYCERSNGTKIIVPEKLIIKT